MASAQHVYFVVILMLFLSLITAPFRALFIARENIIYISIIDTLDGVLRLTLAILLLYVNTDKLITYTWMMLSISVFNLLAFSLYAKRHFPETCLLPQRKDISKQTIMKILDFAGWTWPSHRRHGTFQDLRLHIPKSSAKVTRNSGNTFPA